MKHISQRQGGMTALGIFLILAMLACFFTFGLTLFPLYNEYINVKSGMNSVLNAPPAKRKTTKDIRKIFLRNVELNNVERFTDQSVKELVTVKKSKDGKKKFLNVKYQATNKLFKNIHVMMDVDETIELTGSAPQ
jgi:lipopolysaccharide export LptBFGC system permease protein LptF